MANLSQTPANVAVGDLAIVRVVQAGEAVTQGQPVRNDTSIQKWYKCDATSLANANASAIALTPAAADGYFAIIEGEGQLVNLGATLAVGETYVVSATSGLICPIGDLVSGNFATILGSAVSASLLRTIFEAVGVAKA